MSSDLLIGEISKQSGLSTQAIRYYEKLGLIESPLRSTKGYRLYSSLVIERLQSIQYAQSFGLSLSQIKKLLEFNDLDSSIIALRNMVENNLQDLERQLQTTNKIHRDLSKRHQQLTNAIASGNYNNNGNLDSDLLNLFESIEANLSVNNQTTNKARQLLELYSAGERNFQALELNSAELNGAYLCEADFSYAEMMLVSLNEASMERTKFNQAYLMGADSIDAYLHQAELVKANLVGADLSGADLTEANLTECNLGGADLSNADLRGANLTEAVLIGANLKNANLQGAIILGCNFIEANLENATFDDDVAERLNITITATSS